MEKQGQIYSGRDVVFIIPTKDRPDKMKNLLDSLARQTTGCGRVIIVDGGQSVKDIVMGFGDRLPVEYYECHPPGQIRQRNKPLSLLDSRTPLVGFLDDDIVLERRALEAMITFWNKCGPDTAGVSFNIVNNPPLSSLMDERCYRDEFATTGPGTSFRIQCSRITRNFRFKNPVAVRRRDHVETGNSQEVY